MAGLELVNFSVYTTGTIVYNGQTVDYHPNFGETLNISRIATGKYRINHNFNNQNYYYIVSPSYKSANNVLATTLAANYFDIELLRDGSYADGACRCIILKFN